MARSPKRRDLATGILVVLMAGMLVSQAMQASANHTPANKVVAAGSKAVVMAPQTDATLLTATLRTSKPTDLILSVALECSIISDVTTGPSTVGGATDSATAEGTVRVWVEIDGNIVPINSISAPPQDPADQNPGDDTDKVTYCNRVHTQEATDGENNPPGGDGIDKYRTYLETKTANAFNWLRLNMGSGIHTIVVKGELTTDTAGEAVADAIVGNRSLIVEPEKLANDATI